MSTTSTASSNNPVDPTASDKKSEGAVAPQGEAAAQPQIVTFEQQLHELRKGFPRQWHRGVVIGELASPRVTPVWCDDRVCRIYGYDVNGNHVVRSSPLLEFEFRAFLPERVKPALAFELLGTYIQNTDFYTAMKEGIPVFVVAHFPEFDLKKSFQGARLLTVNGEVLSAVLTGRVDKVRAHREDRRSIAVIRRRLDDTRDPIFAVVIGQFDRKEPGKNFNKRTDRIIIYMGQAGMRPADILNALMHYPQLDEQGNPIPESSLIERIDRRMHDDSLRYRKLRAKPVATVKPELETPDSVPQLDDSQTPVEDELQPLETPLEKPRISVNTRAALAWRRCGNKDYRAAEGGKKGKCPAHGQLVLGVIKECATCQATMVRLSKEVTEADKIAFQAKQSSVDQSPPAAPAG